MNTTQLIGKLQATERLHGAVEIRLQVTLTGLNLMDEGGNVMEKIISGASLESAEVEIYERKIVLWLTGECHEDDEEATT